MEEEGSESEEDDGFIISNPNKQKPLNVKKAGVVDYNKKIITQEKQERKEIKMMKEGKTAQAKAELAKLEEIRKEREADKKEKEEAERLKKEKAAASKGKR